MRAPTRRQTYEAPPMQLPHKTGILDLLMKDRSEDDIDKEFRVDDDERLPIRKPRNGILGRSWTRQSLHKLLHEVLGVLVPAFLFLLEDSFPCVGVLTHPSFPQRRRH